MDTDTSEIPKIGLAAGMARTLSEVPLGLLGLASHITFGSFTLEPKEGNKEPKFYYDDATRNSINAVGLTNGGIRHFLDEELPRIVAAFEAHKSEYGTSPKIRVSLAPLQAGDLEKMCRIINDSEVAKYIVEVEVNGACPNHRGDADGRLHPVLARDPVALESLIIEATHLHPRFFVALKIAPEMPKLELIHCVDLCATYHIEIIVSGNTRLGSSVIGGVQRLSVPMGGIAGATLLRSGVQQAQALVDLCKPHEIKVIVSGGILSADDVLRYKNVGADEYQIATGFMKFGPAIFSDIHTALLEK